MTPSPHCGCLVRARTAAAIGNLRARPILDAIAQARIVDYDMDLFAAMSNIFGRRVGQLL